MQRRKLVWLTVIVVAIVVVGTIGFMSYARMTLGNALYETLILILGHHAPIELHNASSRVMAIFLIIASLVAVGYLLTWFAEYIMGLDANVRRSRMKAKIDRLKGHYIICGLGRVGYQVAREMHNEGIHFVTLDRDQAKVDAAVAEGYLALCVDSTAEDALEQAGVMKATGLVASLGEDSHNLLVTLAARSLRPDLYIVARANRQENEVKLKRAGADRVALPYQIGGYHMAAMALRPNVVDYMDIVSNGKGTEALQVEEMLVGEASQLAGRRLGKTLADGQIGATVIAINGADGRSRVRPSGQEMIYPGDRLIILGAKHDLTSASALIR